MCGGAVECVDSRSSLRSCCCHVAATVCLSVCTVKDRRLEPSTPKSVHMYSTAGPQHVVTLRSRVRGQRLSSVVVSYVACVGVCQS